MFRQFLSLLWLRTQIIITNKSVLLQMVMPAGLVYLYKFMIDSQSGSKEQMGIVYLMLCIPLALVLAVGSPILTILAEEKEKNNLKTLLLSGVKDGEYLLSTLIIPLILSVFYLVVIPLILGVKIDNYTNYYVISGGVTLIVLLLYLSLGLVVKSQVMAQVVSVPTMLVIAFLPMLSGMDKTLSKVTDYSFMGLFTKFFSKWENFSWSHAHLQLYSWIVWLFAIIVFTVIAVKQQKKD